MQNALFKIAAKQCLRILMILEWGGHAENFIEDSRKAMFKTLDDALMLDFGAWWVGCWVGGRMLYLR